METIEHLFIGLEQCTLAPSLNNTKAVTAAEWPQVSDRINRESFHRGLFPATMTFAEYQDVAVRIYLSRYRLCVCVCARACVCVFSGAMTRNSRQWSLSLRAALQHFPEMETLCGGHNAPVFGAAEVHGYLTKQADVLKYMHDETLRLMNQGYTPVEIANLIELPPSLSSEWYCRGYYGSVKHNVRGIYTFYLGWYDANPCHLDPLMPRESGVKMLEYMGGVEAVMAKAQADFDQGNYRWVVQVLDHVIWALPHHAAARQLAAKAYTQLGYQAENATWRNAYLCAAQELRGEAARKGGDLSTTSGVKFDIMDVPTVFDLLGIWLNGPRAFGVSLTIQWTFTDFPQPLKYTAAVRNGILAHNEGHTLGTDTDEPIEIIATRAAFQQMLMSKGEPEKVEEVLAGGNFAVEGDFGVLKDFLSLFDKPNASFPIASHEPIGEPVMANGH